MTTAHFSSRARTQRSRSAASRGSLYFAWGCFRDFLSRPCRAPPKGRYAGSGTRDRQYLALTGAWNQKQQRDPGITHDVAQRIDAVVATAIGHHQRLVVMNADEARQIASRRAIQSLRPGRCQRGEGRLVDQHAILRRHSGGDLDGGGLVRLPVNRFQISYRCDDRHCRSPDLGASTTQPLPPANAPLMTRTSSRACCSTLPTLAMVTSGAVAASSTARPSLSASRPSLPRARTARRSARTSAGAVIKITTTSA